MDLQSVWKLEHVGLSPVALVEGFVKCSCWAKRILRLCAVWMCLSVFLKGLDAFNCVYITACMSLCLCEIIHECE